MRILLLLAMGIFMLGGWHVNAAIDSAKRIDRALKELNEMVPSKKLNTIHKELAELFKLELPVLEQAMTKRKYQMSDLVMAYHIGTATSTPFTSVLEENKKREWTKTLQEKKIPLLKTLEYLEEMQGKIGLILIEDRFGKE